MSDNHDEYREALAWFFRVCAGEAKLVDLQIGTVKKHFRTVLRRVGVDEAGRATYSGLCPSCGAAVELRRESTP